MLGVVNLGGPWSSIEDDLDLHASVGLGLQMQTPIGLFALIMVGVKMAEDFILT